MAGDQRTFIKQFAFVECAQAADVICNEFLFTHLGLPARNQAQDLLLKLGLAVTQYLNLSVVLAPTHFKQIFLNRQRIGYAGLLAPCQ